MIKFKKCLFREHLKILNYGRKIVEVFIIRKNPLTKIFWHSKVTPSYKKIKTILLLASM